MPGDDRGARGSGHGTSGRVGGAERGREQERGEPEGQVEGSLRAALPQAEDGGVVPAMREIRLERVTVESLVLRADRCDVDGDEAGVRAHEVVREGELDHGVT